MNALSRKLVIITQQIKQASAVLLNRQKKNGYTIKKTSKSKAMDKGYKICQECFSKKQQESYYELAAIENKFNNYSKWIEDHKGENLGWGELLATAIVEKNINFNNLYVYMDSKSKLHISTYCMELAQDKSAKKVRFDDVSEIYATCEECVGREYVDFIYKKVNDGIYDVSLIGEPEDDD